MWLREKPDTDVFRGHFVQPDCLKRAWGYPFPVITTIPLRDREIGDQLQPVTESIGGLFQEQEVREEAHGNLSSNYSTANAR